MTPAQVLSLARARGGEAALRVLPDERLARLASTGDARAFALIYERHHQELFRYCRSITRNSDDAADALQSTMAAALRSLPGEKRQIALRPWLFRVAHNESIALIRRRRPHDELTDDSATGPDPHGQAALRERLGHLMGDLSRLPERQRGALLMRELSGLSYSEIGAALDVSHGAARQAVYEARLALTELEAGRDMDCDDARMALSAGDRRVMRGRRLTAHMRGCSACRGFGDDVAVRRSALRVLVPPLPAAAGTAILGGLLGIGAGVGAGAAGSAAVGAAAGAGGGGLAAAAGGSISSLAGASAAAKSAAAVALAVAAGVGTVEVTSHAPLERDRGAQAAEQGPSAGAAAHRSPAVAAVAPQDRAADTPTRTADEKAKDRSAATPGKPNERRAVAKIHLPAPNSRRAPKRRPAPVTEPAPAPVEAPAPAPAPTPAPAAAKPNPLKDFIAQQTQQALQMGLQQTQQALTLSQQLLQRILQPRN
jgi:RNA polymerase sigma factor (sigma-70 family)